MNTDIGKVLSIYLCILFPRNDILTSKKLGLKSSHIFLEKQKVLMKGAKWIYLHYKYVFRRYIQI